jgi:hypothetical protein
MIKKITLVIIILFSISTNVFAKEYKYAQIFDPKQDEVVKIIQLNSEIQSLVASYLVDIDAIYGKNDPIPEDGYSIKIPLDPAVKTEKKCLNALIKEVYIIIPEKEQPFIMLFENENKLSCFPFRGDINTLSKALNFNLIKSSPGNCNINTTSHEQF